MQLFLLFSCHALAGDLGGGCQGLGENAVKELATGSRGAQSLSVAGGL